MPTAATTARVCTVTVYPIKSTRGREREAAAVQPWGLAGDRRAMVIDRHGAKLTARTHRKLLTVTADLPEGAGALTVRGPHAEPLTVALPPSGDAVTVSLPRADVTTLGAGPDADEWFSRLLGEPVRLVWLADPAQRPVNPAYGRAADRVGFADAYPLLLIGTASLHQLNDWVTEEALRRGDPGLAEPLAMRRFRPNLTVSGTPPFAEDRWKRIRIGQVTFRVAKACDRCMMTTIDPDTLSGGKEPLRTLARHRKWDGHVWFGMHLIPDSVGVVRVGDEVQVLSEAA